MYNPITLSTVIDYVSGHVHYPFATFTEISGVL